METARVIELYQKEQGYGVFQMNEVDVVAAPSMDEAIRWYQEDEDCHVGPDLSALGLDSSLNYVDNPDSNIRSVTYRELIQEALRAQVAFPCIIATYDW